MMIIEYMHHMDTCHLLYVINERGGQESLLKKLQPERSTATTLASGSATSFSSTPGFRAPSGWFTLGFRPLG